MPNPLPDTLEPLTKQLYTIGEAARILKVSASLLRYWETQFKQIKPKIGPNGERRYEPKDLQQLALIQDLLKNKGYTIQGARNYLSKGHAQNKQVIDMLTELKSFLNQLKDML